MATTYDSAIVLKGERNPKGVTLLAAAIEGGINDIPVAHIEFASRDKKLDLGSVVGTNAGFSYTGANGAVQRFWGTCISAETKGVVDAEGRYVAELRPWLWFLTRARNNRIYQQKTTTDIIKDILGDYGFSGDLEIKHSKSDVARAYCTQYRETDFDFIKRLLEDEGFYFYFAYSDGKAKMILADQVDTHDAKSAFDTIPYLPAEGGGHIEKIDSWGATERAVTGCVTLRDYDFENPSAELTVNSTVKSGAHTHNEYEVYSYPGGYTSAGHGESKAAALIEAEAAAHQTWTATGNVLHLTPGRIFELTDHPRHTKPQDSSFMVTRIRQFLRIETLEGKPVNSVLEPLFGAGMAEGETTAVSFEAVLKSKPFRMPALTPRPQIAGIQTAMVTGKAGEDIWVDKYGRIKVQFHWDRAGKKDERTTCWVRTMMPWTGKGWGMVSWPRIGQEVVIQFEEGDPDRPLCVGMLYNADTMPPYELPANATRSGIKTESSKGGGGYNELMFEDKKGSELVRFGAEKDYVQTVQNAAHVRVGYGQQADTKAAEAQDERSMMLEVENHLDEIVEKGNHSFEVKTGKQDIKIKTDKTEVIEGKSTLTVTDNVTETIKQGNVTRTVSQGNQTVTVKAGNYSVKASAGKITMEAAQSITLKVGGNSIVIDQKGVTIKGTLVTVQANAKLEAKAPMTQVKGDATLILKGGMTMIN
ncbi:type VI secretion system Vgr family protein [Sulfitobacter sabulilitoris]|uniref:Type VI secretion system tip protein VgrG n=1 Tax=Sulfitobacter sabulilitoris TaxID=2562655 RepID=A0A5S3PIF2_9RHOB|nr:type VI secretion system tip protein TssI/VgrG [Sulfitobacter sabulilitoris]TMM54134.1 type VI secretion system tip protein VgrG [Sulfitobacter sabulilitoris]